MPLATHEQKLRLGPGQAKIRDRAYIRCVKPALAALDRSVAQAQRAGWRYFEIATGHDPMVTAPGELTEILIELAGS